MPPTPESFTYDTDGNMGTDGRWSYIWDAENRLAQMETVATAYNNGVPRQLLQFDYDDQGRRIRRLLRRAATVFSPASGGGRRNRGTAPSRTP